MVRTRRLVAGLVAGALTLTSPVAYVVTELGSQDPCDGAVSGRFDDVAESNVHADNIDCIAAYGITQGVGGGNYDPGGHVPRGQMASFLVSFAEVALDERFAAADGSDFTDIAGTTHESNIELAARHGITQGVTPTTYRPNVEVSREQMASLVAGTLELVGLDLDRDAAGVFEDTGGSVHEGNINALAELGIVAGIGDGSYRPSGPVSRAQMASFLAAAMRALDAAGLWEGEIEPSTGPELLHARGSGDGSADTVEVIWDQEVEVVGDATGLTVHEGGGAQTLVASGASVSQQADTVLELTLYGDLSDATTYWLRVAAGTVEGSTGLMNADEELLFTFSVSEPAEGRASIERIAVDGDEVSAGTTVATEETEVQVTGKASAEGATVRSVELRRDGGDWQEVAPDSGAFDSQQEDFTAEVDELAEGVVLLELRAGVAGSDGWSEAFAFALDVSAPDDGSEPDDEPDEEPDVVSIESIVTEPEHDRLVVTFSDDVVCPDTANGRAAWDFRNDSSWDGALAQGVPDSVTEAASAATCLLQYESGVSVGDYGTATYQQPGSPSDQVVDGAGTAVPTHEHVTVLDGAAPTFDDISVSGDDGRIELSFSEPIACVSTGVSKFSVGWDGQTRQVTAVECEGKSSISIGLVMETPPRNQVIVSVLDGEPVTDESGVNAVEQPAVQSIFVP